MPVEVNTVQLFANNAAGTISNVGGISAVDTTVTLQPGEGAEFPAISNPSQFFTVTLASTDESTIEVAKCTARSGDVLTIERAYEGVASIFAQGAKVELRSTQSTLENLRDIPNRILTGGGDVLVDSSGNVITN